MSSPASTGGAAPAGPRDVAGVLLTPGASAGRDHRTLVALEEALAPLPVRRVDFPNRRAGRRGPDRPDAAIACVVEEATAFAAELGVGTDRLVLGGRSFGGRMCSMAVAQGLPAAGLVLLSYPLHPPGRPDQLRVEHLPQVTVPALAVSGLRDPFGTPEELALHLGTIEGPLRLVTVTGDHSPRDDGPVTSEVVAWVRSLRVP
ncbi:alpha/beta hydrolase [Cellulomonas chitinilytica]|uniref:Alpha/beta hydrolase n=1 Tax=Cellulomonas chitinilytica TaxID=398759 RepID=A0A919P164_9CELL|nr:alpha/beta family hydrolase [Cellulomonas chitinilytica]GIG21408.1 alpha/beta hydrolase [Cellulomonas chitinilytica]